MMVDVRVVQELDLLAQLFQKEEHSECEEDA
jgi:hypothetical protein